MIVLTIKFFMVAKIVPIFGPRNIKFEDITLCPSLKMNRPKGFMGY